MSVPDLPLPSWMVLSLSLPVCKWYNNSTSHIWVIVALNEDNAQEAPSGTLAYHICLMFIYLISIIEHVLCAKFHIKLIDSLVAQLTKNPYQCYRRPLFDSWVGNILWKGMGYYSSILGLP